MTEKLRYVKNAARLSAALGATVTEKLIEATYNGGRAAGMSRVGAAYPAMPLLPAYIALSKAAGPYDPGSPSMVGSTEGLSNMAALLPEEPAPVVFIRPAIVAEERPAA